MLLQLEVPMFAALRNLVADLTHGEEKRAFDDNDYRVAAAALLVHAAVIDGNISESERDKLRTRLKSAFNLDDDAVTALIEQATVAEQEAVDMYRFTSLLNRKLDDEGRRRIVEMMWEIVYADHRAGEFEENLLWRVADLLNVPSRDRIELRQRVAGVSESPASS
jgi:uncharacterized tellurite resistance protein B-like protein